MKNHYPQFSDISMPRNYHKSITGHDLYRVVMEGCCWSGTSFSSDEIKMCHHQKGFCEF